jgi:predicted alpha-1,2-mannosidase
MRYSILFIFYIAFLSMGCFAQIDNEQDKDFVDYVNPYMGNISHLLVPTYPTIHLPNSMLRVYPERADFTGDMLKGLPIAVTSHRGSSAFNLSTFQGNEGDIKPVISYSYDREKITPYDYFVYLDEEEVSVYYAVSHQAGIYELEFDRTNPPFLILNSRKGELKWDGKAFSGYQELENNTRIYVYMEPDVQPQQVIKESGTGTNAHVVLSYPANTYKLNVRYGISFIDEEQAKLNLLREIQGFDAIALAKKGRSVWNEALGKIDVKGGSQDDRVVFYTSLYRTYERPVCISEDGRYFSAFDGQIHTDKGIPFYTDDWIWDTYRATHPLRVLTETKLETDILHSFLRMSEQMPEYWWPTFPEITGDSRRMNSNHGIATVLDGYVKGITTIDLEKKYPALRDAVMKKTLAPWSALPSGELDKFYHEHGYIPALREGEKETIKEVHGFEKRQPVAVTLGTAYDEWCLAQIAKILGKTEDYNFFLKKSYNYRNLFNSETHFFHPKDKNGDFIEPFDYKFSGGMGAREYYGENNAWVYRWDVPHNVEDLVHLMGGKEKFIENLDQTFREPLGKSKYEFYAQLPDHTGNVGQFSMANEPSLHIPYLYNYAGQPWKTQKRIRDLINGWFRNDLMGVPGDEDGGGTSAFVVFSQIGFYPVTPGSPSYNIGSPFFDEVTMKLSNGGILHIIAKNNSKDNKYIQSARLNGKEWNKSWFSHEDIKAGGTLELVMGNKANREWGANSGTEPPSEGVKN